MISRIDIWMSMSIIYLVAGTPYRQAFHSNPGRSQNCDLAPFELQHSTILYFSVIWIGIDDQNRNPTKNNREHLVGRPTTLRPQRLGLSFPFTTQTNSLQLKQQMMNILVIGNQLPILNCPAAIIMVLFPTCTLAMFLEGNHCCWHL